MTEPAQDVYRRTLEGSNQSEEQALSSGLDQARGLLQPQGNFSEQLGMQSQPALTEAIRNKTNRQYHTEDQELKRSMKMDAKNAHFNKLQAASQLASDEQRINVQKAIAKYKAKMAKKAARGQLLGSVLGIAGGVVGSIYGGPAGGAAGAAVGQGAGQAIGSEM